MAFMSSAHKPNDENTIVKLNQERQEMLATLAPANSYWSDVQSFITNKEGQAVCSLSERQREWYFTILAGLDREIDKEEGRKAFAESGDFENE